MKNVLHKPILLQMIIMTVFLKLNYAEIIGDVFGRHQSLEKLIYLVRRLLMGKGKGHEWPLKYLIL